MSENLNKSCSISIFDRNKTLGCSKRDVILNVLWNYDNNGIVVFLLHHPNGQSPVYTHRNYMLTDENSSFFDFFEDFFLNRFSFFISSRMVQAFLLTLHDYERQFFDKTGITFADYYGIIIDSAVHTVNDITAIADGSQKERNLTEIPGYGIVHEAVDASAVKSVMVAESKFMTDMRRGFISEFKKNYYVIKDDDYHFICIEHGINDKPTMLMETGLKVPMILYSKKFIPVYFDMMLEPFIKPCGGIDGCLMMDMDKVLVDAVELKNGTNLFDIDHITNDDGELTVEYGINGFGEDNEYFGDIAYTYRFQENELYRDGFAASIG